MFHSSSNLGVVFLVMIVAILPLGGNGQEVSFFAKQPSTLFTFFPGTPFKNVSKNIGKGYNQENGKNICLFLTLVGRPARLRVSRRGRGILAISIIYFIPSTVLEKV